MISDHTVPDTRAILRVCVQMRELKDLNSDRGVHVGKMKNKSESLTKPVVDCREP
jgi:hypothetical protein